MAEDLRQQRRTAQAATAGEKRKREEEVEAEEDGATIRTGDKRQKTREGMMPMIDKYLPVFMRAFSLSSSVSSQLIMTSFSYSLDQDDVHAATNNSSNSSEEAAQLSTTAFQKAA